MISQQTAVQLSILYGERTRLTDALTILSESTPDIRFGFVIYYGREKQPRFAETVKLEHGSVFLKQRIDWMNEQIKLLGGEV